MRLKPETVQEIVSTVQKHLANSPHKLYLYGSRVNDSLRGGDIDLLLLLELTEDKPAAESLKYKILADIKKQIGDQKIDFGIYTRQQIGKEAFLDLILPAALCLA